MSIADIIKEGTKYFRTNQAGVLTGLSLGGLAATVYLTAKGAMEAKQVLDDDPQETIVEQAKLVWPHYVPAASATALTALGIIGVAKTGTARVAAATTAYTVTEKAFREYRERVVQEHGEAKDRKIRDEMARDKIAGTPERDVIIAGAGRVLCCELFTGRYFECDMESLRQSENRINRAINNSLYVTLDEFYDMVGLPHTSQSNLLGWDSERHMELEISSQVTPKGVPALAFEYNYVKSL